LDHSHLRKRLSVTTIPNLCNRPSRRRALFGAPRSAYSLGMPTIDDLTLEQRDALRRGESLTAGPPVLIEAAKSSEILLPKGESVQRNQTWSTQPFTLNDADAEAHKEARIARMMAMQDLVAGSSQVLPLIQAGQHESRDICIGRAKRNDIVIVDDTISSIHAAIEETGVAMLLVDRNSSNGTFVNRNQLNPGDPLPLVSGDCVRFGKRVFYYLTGERLLLFLELRIVKLGGDSRTQ